MFNFVNIMLKFTKDYKFKIIGSVLSIVTLFSNFVYASLGQHEILRVPSSFEDVRNRKRLKPKEVKIQVIRSAIEQARGNLTKASEIYYGKKNPSAFRQLANRYGQLGYAGNLKKY